MTALTTGKYTLTDARNGRELADYVLEMSAHARASMMTDYAALTHMWNKLELEIRELIDHPTETTSIDGFIEQLKAKKSIIAEKVRCQAYGRRPFYGYRGGYPPFRGASPTPPPPPPTRGSFNPRGGSGPTGIQPQQPPTSAYQSPHPSSQQYQQGYQYGRGQLSTGVVRKYA